MAYFYERFGLGHLIERISQLVNLPLIAVNKRLVPLLLLPNKVNHFHCIDPKILINCASPVTVSDRSLFCSERYLKSSNSFYFL